MSSRSCSGRLLECATERSREQHVAEASSSPAKDLVSADEGIKELTWDASPPGATKLDVRLGGAVEIAAAGHEQAVALGEVHHLVDERLAVVAVDDLEAVEAQVREILDRACELRVVRLA